MSKIFMFERQSGEPMAGRSNRVSIETRRNTGEFYGTKKGNLMEEEKCGNVRNQWTDKMTDFSEKRRRWGIPHFFSLPEKWKIFCKKTKFTN